MLRRIDSLVKDAENYRSIFAVLSGEDIRV